MKRLFITGANGFVGTHLCRYLEFKNVSYFAWTRSKHGVLDSVIDRPEMFETSDIVVHLAGRAHIMNETAKNPLEEFRKSNVEATLSLATKAKKYGIKKFIYISSVKVNGEKTHLTPFKADDAPQPFDYYAQSKTEAEIALLKLHEKNIFEVIIIRPPLIYGPDVKANFALLMRLIQWPLPLPFGSVNNKRSLVSVYNLSDLILKCARFGMGQKAEIFLVADSSSYSLKQLIIHLSEIQNKKIWLISIPVALLKLPLRLFGKSSLIDRLFGNLEVDIEKTKNLLDWKPPYSFVETFSLFK